MLPLLLAGLCAPHQEPAPALVTPTALETALPLDRRFPTHTASGDPLPSGEFEDRLRAQVERPLDVIGGVPVYFGDLVFACQASDWQPDTVDALLTPWRERLDDQRYYDMRALLDCRDLYSPQWDPDDDDELAGFLFGPTWEFTAQEFLDLPGDDDVISIAVLHNADLRTMLEASRDWACYFDYVGGRYEEIGPRDDSWMICRDAEGRIASELFQVDVACDLPFPLGGYSLDLQLLHQAQDDGTVRGWHWGGGDDLHWYAGTDLYLPVRTTDGRLVGLVQVRSTGFDLRGVPDRMSHRRGAQRTLLGNLRLQGEKRKSSVGRAVPDYDPDAGLPTVPLEVPPLKAAVDASGKPGSGRASG